MKLNFCEYVDVRKIDQHLQQYIEQMIRSIEIL